MGTIADKLDYIWQAREEIRAAIVEKGVTCPGSAPFCSFDDFIRQITTSDPSTYIPFESSASWIPLTIPQGKASTAFTTSTDCFENTCCDILPEYQIGIVINSFTMENTFISTAKGELTNDS